jgi:transcriptional regulator with XRE-family HTH domain
MDERTLNGEAAKALREALGIPASTFATNVGMSPGQLVNIEAGRKKASPDASRRIAASLQAALPAPPTARRRRAVDVWLAITYPTALQETA